MVLKFVKTKDLLFHVSFSNFSVSSRTKPFLFTCSLWPLPKLVNVVNREDKLNGREEEWAKVKPEADVEEAKELIELE